ncbi:MAG: nucleotide sugar dehydrogenase [Armatimonadetes bacterium]|nr:nucleotide sugar dehydrogenase [Armatimonadota bacterium]
MQSVVPDNAVIDALIERIQTKVAKVAVIGLGYVGLPFAVEKAKVGFSVLGVEQNPKRADRVNKGDNYIKDVDDAELADLVEKGLITATTEFERIRECDVLVICVPTPLTKNLTPELSYVENVTREIAQYLRPGQLISLESTTYPGTTEEVMLPILAASGLKVDQDFFLAHSPERVDPGNARYTTKNTHKVVGGVGPNSKRVAVEFYSQTITNVIPVSSAKAAELTKVFENTFRAVNIALVNELTLLCDRMDLDVWEVLDAAFTKPFGIMPFYPGPGVGGHCIPIDPHYLEWKAKELNFNTHFIALAGEINRSMPEFVVEKASRILNDQGVALSRSKILLLGVAYKNDIDDWRESPAFDVWARLEEFGATVDYHDHWVPECELKGTFRKSVPLTDALIEAADLVLITTSHKVVDYSHVVSLAKAVFDTRNATKGIVSEKITKL